VGLRKRSAALTAVAGVAAAALAITGCSSNGSSSTTSSSAGSSGSSSASSNTSSAASTLTVWRMGGSVASQVTWMNGVVAQFHQQFPQYANTKVNVDWIPWGNRTQDWNNALSSGKNIPDITELGNTDTPTEAASGILAPLTSDLSSWSGTKGLVSGMLANDTQNGTTYAVPWFGGVRGVWYRTDQFKAAGITSTPTTWAALLADAQKLQKKYPGTYGFDAITNDTNAFASFIWGAGGQIATQNSSGQWTADLTSPQTEAAISYYVSLYKTYHVSPSTYVGESELGVAGATAGGPNEDFGLGKLDMYIDGPWAKATLPANSKDTANISSFPIPSQNGPNPAPVFSGGSDLAVFKTSPNQQAAWDLITVMDNPTNSTSFAKLSGFFSPYSASISSTYTGDSFMQGFAAAALNGQTAPLNAKNWPTADNGKYNIIPTMLKQLMNGASLSSTVAGANTQLQTVLNTGSES
jgi:ABC-type glycerol-3-phosphate transport system substrate-binding protein